MGVQATQRVRAHTHTHHYICKLLISIKSSQNSSCNWLSSSVGGEKKKDWWGEGKHLLPFVAGCPLQLGLHMFLRSICSRNPWAGVAFFTLQCLCQYSYPEPDFLWRCLGVLWNSSSVMKWLREGLPTARAFAKQVGIFEILTGLKVKKFDFLNLVFPKYIIS